MALKRFLLLTITVELLACGVTSKVSESRDRRSDDGGPLEAVVEQLSQQVSSLTAQLNTANTRIATLEAKTASLQKNVAFYARNGVNPIHTGPHGTLILNLAITNIGNAYDAGTGVFTAPVSGLYDFQARFMSYTSSDNKVYAGIYVDGQMKSEGVADSGHGFWDQTTTRIIVHLTSGQKVTLRNTQDAVRQFYAYWYTTFSGFLLKAD